MFNRGTFIEHVDMGFLELLVAYSIFCSGCGFLQAAANKTPGLGPDALPLNAPLWFTGPTARFVVGGIGILSLLSEIVIGFILIAWWAGLFFWLPANLLAHLLIRTKNPAPAFFVGLLIAVIGIIFIVLKEDVF